MNSGAAPAGPVVTDIRSRAMGSLNSKTRVCSPAGTPFAPSAGHDPTN